MEPAGQPAWGAAGEPHYDPPAARFTSVSWDRVQVSLGSPAAARRSLLTAPRLPSPLQPVRKAHVSKILPNMAGVRTDDQLEELLQRHGGDTVMVNFGSSWCHHCHQMFPAFVSLSRQFPQLKYAVAQVGGGGLD